MTRSSMRNRGATWAIGALLLVSACHRTRLEPEFRTKTTGEREVEDPAPARPKHLGGPRDPGPPQSFSGRKTPGLSGYIENLNEADLLKYLNSLVYDDDRATTEIDSVTCVHAGNSGPCTAGEAAELFIQPEIGAHKWKHSDAKSFGLIVGRIINYSTGLDEKNFNFPARTKVWWVVDEDPATHLPRSRFFKRTYSTTAPFVEQVGVTRPYYDCGHAHDRGPHYEAIAKYVSCSQSLTMDAPRDRGLSRAAQLPANDGFGLLRLVSSRTVLARPRPSVPRELTSTWITCEMGCCSTTQ